MRADSYRTLGLVGYSAAAHLVIVALAVFAPRKAAPPRSEPPPVELVDVDLQAPGGGAPAEVRPQRPADPTPRHAPRHAAEDKDAVLPAVASSAPPMPAPPASSAPPLATSAAPAPPASISAPVAGPPGPVGPAGSGTSTGPGAGAGPAGTGTSAAYRARVSGWFSARVSLGGATSSEPHPLLRVGVAITLSGRKPTGFSITSPSGDAGFDGRIERRLRDIVSSGAEIPEPEEGALVPPNLSLSFTCKPSERCS